MTKRAVIPPSKVLSHVSRLFGDDLHAKRVLSLSDATVGALHAGAVGVHAIGRGLAAAKGLSDKHAVKQVDRFLSNRGFSTAELYPSWVRYVLGDRREVVVNLDWTEFDGDDQATLFIAAQTGHGRAIPLVWKTVRKSEMKDRRNDYEDDLLDQFSKVVPEGVRVTVVADRGFADQKLFRFLPEELGFGYVIRFRAVVHVTSETGEKRNAGAWLSEGGAMKVLRNARVTADRCPVPTVVVVRDPAMKDAWCLASSDPDATGTEVKRLYGKRFSIEETFRDTKDLRYGMGMSWNSVGTPERRDRMILVAVLAQSLLTVLGEAGEALKLDRLLKTNTAKKRTLSLLRQGLLWYERVPTMPEDRLKALMTKFGELLSQHNVFNLALGLNPASK